MARSELRIETMRCLVGLLFVAVLSLGHAQTIQLVSTPSAFLTALNQSRANEITLIELEKDVNLTDVSLPIELGMGRAIVVRSREGLRRLSFTLPRVLRVPISDIARASQNSPSTLLERGSGMALEPSCLPWSQPALAFQTVALGDIDGDGFVDLGFATQVEGRWIVQLLLGGPPVDASASRLSATSLVLPPGVRFNSTVALGDVNADGKGDFAVSYVRDDNPANQAVLVILGSESLQEQRSVSLNDPDSLECGAQRLVPAVQSGFSATIVAGAGDIDGDGFDDFVLGVPPYAYFHFGGRRLGDSIFTFDQSRAPLVSGKAVDFGGALAAGLDFDGDGLPDVAIGAPSASEVQVLRRVQAFKPLFPRSALLRADVETLPRITFFGNATLPSCGQALVMKDLDNDGLGDLAIVCGSSAARRMFILFGRNDWAANARVNIADDGVEVILPRLTVDAVDADACDVDGDGYVDLLVRDTRSGFYIVRSPGRSRALLRAEGGLFILRDNASLVLDSVQISSPGPRIASALGSANTMLFNRSTVRSGDGPLLRCPATLDTRTRSSVCPSCKDPLADGCARTCPSLPGATLARITPTRLETNLEGFKVLEMGNGQFVVAHFNPSSSRILVSVYKPLELANCTSLVDIPVTSRAAVYLVEANSERAPYSGAMALFFDVVLADVDSFSVVYLGDDNVVYARDWQPELLAFRPERTVVSLREFGRAPPLRSLAVIIKSCASSPLGKGVCFLGYFRAQSPTPYLAVAFSADGSVMRQLAVFDDEGNNRYPFNQLELYTLARNQDQEMTVSGGGHYVSVLTPTRFIVAYMQRDDSIDLIETSELLLSVFDASTLSPIADRVTFDSVNGLVMRLAIAASSLDYEGVYLAAQRFDPLEVLLYQLVDNTFVRIAQSVRIAPSMSPFSGMDLAVMQNGRLGVFLHAGSLGRSLFVVDPSNPLSVALVSSEPSLSAAEAPLTSLKSAWLLPRSGLALVTTVAVDKLTAEGRKAGDFTAKVNAYMQQYPDSGFPLTLRLEAHSLAAIASGNTTLVCPLGHYCALGQVTPCAGGSFQTLHPKRMLGDCETSNVCEPGFFCGSGAALGGSYRKLIEPNLRSITAQVFAGAQRTLELSWRNSDLRDRSVKIALRSVLPAWLSFTATPPSRSFLMTKDSEAVLTGSIPFKLLVTVDSSKAQDLGTGILTANLTWEWWLEDLPQERFRLEMPVSAQVVPVLIVPRNFNFTLGDDAAVESDQGISVLYNIFPSNQIRARVLLGCKGESAAPGWLKIAQEYLQTEIVLEPGLGASFNLPFVVNASAAGPRSRGPDHPAEMLQTCFRFNCTVDEAVQFEEEVRLSLVVVQRCPPQFFSPASGANTLDHGCLPCASDSYQPTPGSIQCIPAPRCPRGTFSESNGLRFNDSSCVLCPRGWFQPLEGSSKCLQCPSGFFGASEGAFECTSCPVQLQGAQRLGAKAESECQSSPGYYKQVLPDGRVEALQCPDGTNCSGPVELAALPLTPGFWRASLNSSSVISCRRLQYCAGAPDGGPTRRNLASGESESDEYCRENHLGVMCEKCPPGFAKRGANRICTECNSTLSSLDAGSTAGILIAILLVPSVCSGVLFFLQQRSRQGGLKATSRVWTALRLADGGTKPKLIIGLMQVVAACASNFRFSFPPAFTSVAQSFSIFYVDTLSVIDLGCALQIAPESFWKSLLITTIAPMVALGIILILTRILVRVGVDPDDENTQKRIRTVSAAISLFTIFLVYPGASNTVIKTFICDSFDDGRVVLRADYAIPCYDSVWRAYAVYAGFMVLVYVIGIPLFFIFLVVRYRRGLNPNKSGPLLDRRAQEAVQLRDQVPEMKWLFFLVHAYLPFYSWFEPLDLVIRLIQTSVVLAFSETWAQILFLCCVTVAYLLLLVQLAPYVKRTNHVLACLCQISILSIGLVALVYTLNKSKVNAVAMDVICFMALFGPILTAFPLHCVQIRVSRWKGFFDAHETYDVKAPGRHKRASLGSNPDEDDAAPSLQPSFVETASRVLPVGGSSTSTDKNNGTDPELASSLASALAQGDLAQPTATQQHMEMMSEAPSTIMEMPTRAQGDTDTAQPSNVRKLDDEGERKRRQSDAFSNEVVDLV